MKALKICGIAMLLTAATAYAIDGVVLKYVYKKDAVTKTRIKGTIDVQGMEITVTLLNQAKVLSVAEDGTATVEDKTLEGKFSMNGQEQEMPETPTFTMIMKPNGEIKEIKGQDVSEGMYRVQNLTAFIPPKEAIQVGSKWKNEVPANKETKAPGYKAEYSVLADENGSLKIQAKTMETEGSDPASMEGTLWIDKANCDIVKSSMKWNNVPSPGVPFPISGTFTSERVK